MATFRIYSKYNNLYLAQSTADDQLIAFDPKHPQDVMAARQTGGLEQIIALRGFQTQAENLGRGYQISFLTSIGAYGLVADVPGFSRNPKQSIQLWTENGGTNQLWSFFALGGASFVIWNCHNSLVLEVPAASKEPGAVRQNDTQPKNWDSPSDANQVWIWTITDPAPATLTVTPNGSPNGNDVPVIVKGSNLARNVTYQLYLMNTPGATVGAFPPTSDSFVSDSQGNFTKSTTLTGPWKQGGGASTPFALCLLEDPNNYVDAICAVPNSIFPNG